MIASVVNAAAILLGGLAGLLFGSRIKERYSRAVQAALALCIMPIAIKNAIGGQDALCVIICMVVGTLAGELLRIEDRLDNVGEFLKSKFASGGSNSRFTEGFMSATILFGVGAMAIVGSIEAGINNNYDIIFSKSLIDGVTAIIFASTMGLGVLFSAAPILVYQGGLTLLAIALGSQLPTEIVSEMSAVGGLIMIGISVNMLGISNVKLRVGNMLPAIFLPLAYIPLKDLLLGLISA